MTEVPSEPKRTAEEKYETSKSVATGLEEQRVSENRAKSEILKAARLQQIEAEGKAD